MPQSRSISPELLLLSQIKERFGGRLPSKVALGIGDDCAILRPPPNHDLLVTTDFSLEGRHFLRHTHPPFAIGHRTLMRGLSDLAAMGATPLAAFLSLALPVNLTRTSTGNRWVTAFFDGLQSLARSTRVPLAGGDTSQSPADYILADIILLGTAPVGTPLRRSTAFPGDFLYVTGSLGGAAAELRKLLARTSPPRTLRADRHYPHLLPQPRLATGRALRNRASACIDLSDGLATDLIHLCESSHLRAEVDTSALPLASTLEDALYGGEDYELLFSAPSATPIPRTIAKVPITRIGRLLRPSPRHPRLTLLTPGKPPQAPRPASGHHFAK